MGEQNNVSLVIWTTTPWTLPANLAIAVHPDFDYAVVRVGEEILVVAADLADGFLKAQLGPCKGSADIHGSGHANWRA